jgi:hypothetical protein
MREEGIERRLAVLERRVRRQRIAIVAMGLAGAGGLLIAAAPRTADVIDAHAIRILDAANKPRILIGAPPPSEGRERKDGQTASIVVLGPDGHDRLILGETPNPRLDGKSFPRIATGYGLVLHNAQGSERGGIAYLDNGRGVIALDRPGGDAVEMIANDATGFAGLTINYATPLGQGKEGVRIGTQGDRAWLSLQDRAEGERARLAVDGPDAPRLATRAAGAPPAP